MTEKFLISQQEYLSAGIHIGMKSRTKDMRRFIYKVREDGLSVLDLKLLDDRIKTAIKFLSTAEKLLVVGRKTNSHIPIKKFCEVVGCDYVVGRFMPGTLTNPNYKKFMEPDMILLTDPLSDYQALKESIDSRIPVVALCDTFNETRNIDLVVPCNNKGKKALALMFWILAKEISKKKGKKTFQYKVDDFLGSKKED